MFNQNKKPWPYFKVKISNNQKENETIKIQAKNESMAGFLALRKSSVCEKAGWGKVDNVEQVAS